jgi:hypothetical protein
MPDWSRRQFLLTTSGLVPAIRGTITDERKEAPESGNKLDETTNKYTPVGLEDYFTASATEFGTRERPRMIGEEAGRVGLVHVLGGRRSLQGIPFWLGSEEVEKRSWIVLSTQPGALASKQVEIPLKRAAHYICLASFCDWDKNEAPLPGQDAFEQVGQVLANVTLIYEDGSQHILPIRRRYETSSYVAHSDRLSAGCYAALPPVKPTATRLDDPLPHGTNWGGLQTGLRLGGPGGTGLDYVWVCALKNPQPERSLQALQLEAVGEDPWIVCGLTLFHQPDSPLRYERLSRYRLTLPKPEAEDRDRWKLELDLGVIVRTFTLPDFERQAWLSSPSAGLGETLPPKGARFLYAELTASPAATLILRDLKTGGSYEFDLAQITSGQELEARRGGSRIEVLEPNKTWVHARVLDSATGRPTPVRLAFRSKEGRYIPPYGHRTEVNDGWFQDYGADLKILDSPFAYVDGMLQVELPVGEVYVEMMKGFEYEAVRQRLEIKPGQRDLSLTIPRFINLRSEGWVTADTHTHFLPPTTALLEAQAEGLNLINLLAAQWGVFFSNVGDFSHEPLVSPDHESMVWVGTENRHHLLGHLALLGVHGAAVYPMSVDGVFESWFGDPLSTSLADWADAAREREGLAVCAHFPYPTGEIAADIVLGKIDALEIWPRDEVLRQASPLEQFNTLRYLDWYHYLNCGYRLPAVGGTDKMGAETAAGANRVYTYIGQEEFNFANWAAGVRKGNTFVTSGPLLFFQTDGHPPGEDIVLGAGGGTVEVAAEVKSFVPIHRLEVILNGCVVASREAPAGVRAMTLKEKIKVPGPGWLAARCASRLGPVGGREYKIAAHTSAVYVRVPGEDLFSAPAATYFLKLIDGAETYVETLAVRPDPERLVSIRKTFTDARAELHRRLHHHGVSH